MEAEALIRNGDPQGALASLQDEVRANPQDAKLRVFLFQLLCVLGDWKRAINQLKLCAELDPSATPMAQTYREAIICEVYREKVFSGEKEPLIFGKPKEWLAYLVQANSLSGRGEHATAADMRGKAFDQAPTTSGTLNGQPFDWIADADMRLGPVLEAIINGKYYWLPFDAIGSLTFEAPGDLRDFVWMPATLGFPNGGDAVALIPTRYPGTTDRDNSAEMLSRATNWEEAATDTFFGFGQRLLTTNALEIGLCDLRELKTEYAAEGQGDG
ncbi:type VI secretion system accessory protein TagJ [Qingshengfaniella alkalisoli]|uniref:Virulence protein SciE type n=1 Tax=Qingshengfaniella alkalisoli TaxID=2599296 RepID=A0A5B8J9M3_9RHOB|nr:type VI secretion system accessory protein TagJ [Qingshengfaniella alkalisoli]QDY70930.1 virulence protein SciE type [Qingshengfaniella alkalisoli]